MVRIWTGNLVLDSSKPAWGLVDWLISRKKFLNRPITMQACGCRAPSCQYPSFPGSGLPGVLVYIPWLGPIPTAVEAPEVHFGADGRVSRTFCLTMKSHRRRPAQATKLKKKQNAIISHTIFLLCIVKHMRSNHVNIKKINCDMQGNCQQY